MDEGIPQTKDVVFIVRVALVIELKDLQSMKMNGAVIEYKLIPGW
jgi:hypothetical protein